MPLSCLLITLSWTRPIKVVKLALVSPQYAIRGGQLIVLPSEIFKETGDTPVLPDGIAPKLAGSDVDARPAAIRDDGTAVVEIPRVGSYTIILSQLDILRLSDERSFLVSNLILPNLTLSQRELKEGKVDVPIGQSPLLAVRVLEPGGRIAADKQVSFQPRGAGLRVIQLRTDRNGEIFMLGSSEEYTIRLIPGQGQGLKLEIFVP